MYYFTSDEHFGHTNIIRFCDRPFSSVEEMDEVLISNFNSIVTDEDTTIHAGDFTLTTKKETVWRKYINRLNGNHIFLKGSHDKWLKNINASYMREENIEGQFLVVCHYAMRTWHRSHYNSWQLYGHSHGRLEPVGKQWDIGVDNNNYFPLSFEDIRNIMNTRPDNPNLVRKQ